MFRIQNSTDYPRTVDARFIVLAVGVIGLTFPFILVVGAAFLEGCEIIQGSLSAYYHTIMRNYFVGAICAIAICLFAYNGFACLDKYVAKVAGVMALGVAFFPTSLEETNACLEVYRPVRDWVNTVHFISAALLFLSFAFFSFFIFTNHKSKPDFAKKLRLGIFKFSGIMIIVCILLIGLYFWVFKAKFPQWEAYSPVYWLELFALVFFSLSWLVKAIDIHKPYPAET